MMRLHTLTDVFATLEATSSRLAMVKLVANVLGRATEDELELVVCLLQGRLGPPYEGVETGIGEKLLVRILAHTYHESDAVVTRSYKRTGDLGLVAEALSPAGPRKPLTIRQAYAMLLQVAQTKGAGTVMRKQALLTTLLQRIGGGEAKYIVRVVQGRLRLGVGDQTILEAAALGALGDRRKKALLEQAYNVRSDLGGVVRLAYTTGERGLAHLDPEIGVPVRPALAQRLASTEEIIQRLGTVEAEPKYDGFRLQLHRDGHQVWIFSRRLENVTAMFPDLAAGMRRQCQARRAIIEGEAVVYNPKTGEFLPFQVTMTRKRTSAIAETAERHPLRLFAFDVLSVNGKSCLAQSQHDRHQRLARLLPCTPDDPIVVTDVHVSRRPGDLQTYFTAMLRRGFEGIIAKDPAAPYHPGARRYSWVKLKRASQTTLRDTVDVVLIGYFYGRGKRAAAGIGSLVAAVYDPEHDRFRTIAKIGSALSEQDWKRVRVLLDAQTTRSTPRRVDSLITPDVWVEPRYVVAVLADEITRSPSHTCGKTDHEPGYALRFPRIMDGVRADKAPEDATTQDEICELYRMQRHVAVGATAVRKTPRSTR